MKLIVAANEDIIAGDGDIPWDIKEDKAFFRTMTFGKIIVYGYGTWVSLGKKPLPNRVNIIISKNHYNEDETDPDIYWFRDPRDFLTKFYNKEKVEEIFIIGGAEIYNWFLDRNYIQEIYFSEVYKPYPPPICHITYFKKRQEFTQNFTEARILHSSEYDVFHYKIKNKDESRYLKIMKEILTESKVEEDRTGTGTLSLPGKSFEFDISDTIPLLTTKQVNFRMIVEELLWFLRGETDSKILEQKGVNIWRANSSAEFHEKTGLSNYREGDIGPMYGWQWRHYGAVYEGCDANYEGKGFDQLEALIEGIKAEPYSRRHVMTSYNPLDCKEGVLYPCHGLTIQFYCRNNKISCIMTQRSMDLFLGAPFNFVSYALLTYLVGLRVNMKPHKLIINAGDVHIYANHINQCKTQIKRSPYQFPRVEISGDAEKKFEDYCFDDFKLIDYKHHPRIAGKMSV